HHEPAAPDVPGRRVRHREREAGRDRRVDGVAARLQDAGADVARERVRRDDDPVPRPHDARLRRHAPRRRGRRARGEGRRGAGEEQTPPPSRSVCSHVTPPSNRFHLGPGSAPHTANDGGTRRGCPVVSWYAFAPASAPASPHRLPMNEMLTGVPSVANPLGTTTAGWPVRFVISSTFPPYDGVTKTSTARIASSIAAMSILRIRLAWMYSTAGMKRASRKISGQLLRSSMSASR